VIVFNDPGIICTNGGAVALIAAPAGGTWSGTGVTNSGSYNPATSAGPTVTVSYEIAGVCTVSEDLVLDITPEPLPDAGEDQSICAGETATLTVDGTWDTISWTGGGAGQSTNVTAQGNYTVTVSSGGCTGNDQVFLTVISMPAINLGQDVAICEGDSQVISAPFVGDWSTNETSQSITVSQTGIYSYVYPNSGCPVGDEIYVEVLPYFVLDLGPDQFICPGDSVILESIYDVIWSTGVTATSIEVSTEQLVTAQVNNGPCLSSDQIMITELPLPIADLGPDLTICLGEDVMLSAFHPYNASYLWSDGTTEQTIGFQAFDELTYFFEVTVANQCGEASDDISVLVEDCDPVFYIANAFTPDDDGINDVWRPGVRNVVAYELFVIDRWGNVVFTSSDPEQYWLGNYIGGTHYVQPDVYLYRISYTTDRYDAGHIEGHVTVIR